MSMLTENEVLAMEQKAKRQRRMNRAIADYAVNGTSNAQYQERVQSENDRSQDLADRAHERRMRRRANFIESNPHAVSGTERQRVLGTVAEQKQRANLIQDRQAQFAHEQQMGRIKNEGLIGQGSKAAEFHAGAEKYKADKVLRGHELQWGAQERIAQGQNTSNESIAKIQTDAQKAIAREQGDVQSYGADQQLEGTKYAADKNAQIAQSNAEAARLQAEAAHAQKMALQAQKDNAKAGLQREKLMLKYMSDLRAVNNDLSEEELRKRAKVLVDQEIGAADDLSGFEV